MMGARIRFKLLPSCKEYWDEIYLSFMEDSVYKGVYWGHCDLGKCSVMFFAKPSTKPGILDREIKKAMRYMCYRCERSIKSAQSEARKAKEAPLIKEYLQTPGFRLLPECEEYQRKLYLLFENIKEKGYWKTRCPLSGRCITFERSDEVLLAHQKWAAIHDMCFWCDRSIKK